MIWIPLIKNCSNPGMLNNEFEKLISKDTEDLHLIMNVLHFKLKRQILSPLMLLYQISRPTLLFWWQCSKPLAFHPIYLRWNTVFLITAGFWFTWMGLQAVTDFLSTVLTIFYISGNFYPFQNPSRVSINVLLYLELVSPQNYSL